MMNILSGLLIGLLLSTGAMARDDHRYRDCGSYCEGYRDGYREGRHDRYDWRGPAPSSPARSFSTPRRVAPAGVDLNSIYGGSRWWEKSRK